jgi:preprotein translocase subunit SecG
VVERNLNRLTVFCGVVWAICIVGIGILLKVG